ncbi:MAG: universal stress protein [Burkholderiaceae bacterium]|nr:universal stress protein [Burkholderiaceae bacterium]
MDDKAMLKIVVAFDGSNEAERALDRLSWFDRENADVLVVGIVDSGPALDDKGDAVEADPTELAAARRSVDDAVARLFDRGIRAEGKVVVGDPRRSIVDVAASEGADLIVTGCRGLGRATRGVVGSVRPAVHNTGWGRVWGWRCGRGGPPPHRSARTAHDADPRPPRSMQARIVAFPNGCKGASIA